MDEPKELEKPDFEFESEGQKVSVFVEDEVRETETKTKSFSINPDSLKRISQMHSIGMRREDIAKVEGLSPSTFGKMVDSIPQLKEALEKGRAVGKRIVLQGLFQSLMKDPNPASAFQWLFLFGGEQSPNRLSLTDKAGEPLPVDNLTPEHRLKALSHLSQLLVKGGVMTSKQQLEIQKENEEDLSRVIENEKIIIRRVSGGKSES